MKKIVSLMLALLILIFLIGCSQTPAGPISDPSSDNLDASSSLQETDPPVEPTVPTDPVAPEPTEPTEAPTSAPRQDGMRLSTEQLDYFQTLFRAQGNETFERVHASYYNLALARSFDSAQDISLSTFFSLGFSNEWSKPITDAERAYYCKALGYDEFPLDIKRLPEALVEYVLDYYFCEEMDMSTSGLVYNPDTQCYYWGGSDTAIYPNVSFTDGYFDEATGMVNLYYTHYAKGEEYIITLQSKRSLGETGYYIISNLPAA